MSMCNAGGRRCIRTRIDPVFDLVAKATVAASLCPRGDRSTVNQIAIRTEYGGLE